MFQKQLLIVCSSVLLMKQKNDVSLKCMKAPKRKYSIWNISHFGLSK